MVNNLIFSFFWFKQVTAPIDTGQAEAAFPTYFGILGAASANNGGIYPVGVNWAYVPSGHRVGQGQFIDDFSVVKGSHSLKIGVNLRKNRVTTLLDTGSIGSYFFANIVDFANGVTNVNNNSYYHQVFSPLQSTHERLYSLGVYAMDEWTVKPNLKLTLGIRLDRTGNPTCVDKCYSYLRDQFTLASFQKGADIPYSSSIETDVSHAYYNVDPVVADPRVGLVWSPTNGKGTVLRSGIGLFSDLIPNILTGTTNPPYPYTANIFQGQEVGLASDQNSAATAALRQFNAFKSGFFSGQTLAQLMNSVPGGFSPPGYFSVPRLFRTPQYAEWSIEVQQPIGAKSALVATYSGNYGYDLIIPNGFANAYVANRKQFPNGFGSLPPVAPDPRFSGVLELNNGGTSTYNGVSIQFRRSLAAGFQGQISYTWSHALDDLSNGGAINYTYVSLTGVASPSTRELHSNADYDVRHSLLADFLWSTPWKLRNRILDEVANNWTLGGKFFLRSGSPYSVIDSALAGTLSPNIEAIMLASYAAPSRLKTNCSASAVNTPCYTLSDFVPSLHETGFGNVARNSFYGPGYFDVDATLLKTVPIKERARLAVGAQVYNLMNRPHFAFPNGDVAGPGFGKITFTVEQPTSPYGLFQGASVSGRVVAITGRVNF